MAGAAVDQEIDLSAGLVPKTAPAAGSGGSGGANVSRFLHAPDLEAAARTGAPIPATTPVVAPSPDDIDLTAGMEAKPQQSWRDQVISYLSRPKGDGPVTPHGEESYPEYAARRALGGAAAMVLHPWDTAQAMVKQPIEAAFAAGAHNWSQTPEQNRQHIKQVVTDIDAELDRESAAGHDPGVIGAAKSWLYHAIANAHEDTEQQLTQLRDNFKQDPVGTLADMAGQAILTHGVAKGTGAAIEGVKAKIRAGVEGTAKAMLGVSPADTADIVRETGERNAAAEAAAQQKNQAALAKHAEDLDKIRADNLRREQAYQSRVDAAKSTYDDNAAAAAQTLQDAQEAEGQRGELARQELTLRNRLAQRVKAVQQQAKATVDQMFNAVRAKVGDATTPVMPLVESVGQAEQMFQGSSEKVGIFQDILRRAQDAGRENSLEGYRQQAMEAAGMKGSYEDLHEEARSKIDRLAEDMQDQHRQQYGESEDHAKGISFGDLRGYSSELGKALRSNLDGDVRRGVQLVKDQVDAMAQSLADKAGAGAKLRSAKKSWASYLSTFDEATGPSGSGSPVAKSLDAADITHATEPFLSDDPAIAGRARRLLVGDQFGNSPHYDPNAGKLIDQLRAVKARQAKLPKPAATAKIIAEGAGPAAEFQPPARNIGETPKPEPTAPPAVPAELEDLTPERFQQLQEAKILDTLAKWRRISQYRIVGMIGGGLGMITGLSGIATDFSKSLRKVYGGAGTAIVSALGPKMVSDFINNPEIIQRLAKPTRADLEHFMALPESQRTGVSEMLTAMAEEAARQGKLAAPSPWLAVLSATNKPAREQLQQQSQQDRDHDKQVLQDLTDQQNAIEQYHRNQAARSQPETEEVSQ